MEENMRFFKQPTIELRDTLFGDLPVDQWTGNGSESQAFPWSAFVLARARMKSGDRENAVKNWYEVVSHPGMEPRHYLQAWHFLRQNGHEPPPEIARQLLGIVVEVGMPNGLDLLAAYPDHSARYHNLSGKGVVWEHPNDSLNSTIDELLATAARIVAQIGPWDKPRPEVPAANHVRLCFLTPSGLHFGQAHMDVMSKDPRGGQMLYLAGGLMQALVAKSMGAAAA
jgi:hypothetical protein